MLVQVEAKSRFSRFPPKRLTAGVRTILTSKLAGTGEREGDFLQNMFYNIDNPD